jgi:hypothetical protein
MTTIFNTTKCIDKDAPLFLPDKDREALLLIKEHNMYVSYVVLDLSYLNMFKNNIAADILISNITYSFNYKLNEREADYVKYIVLQEIIITVMSNLNTIRCNGLDVILVNDCCNKILTSLHDKYITVNLSEDNSMLFKNNLTSIINMVHSVIIENITTDVDIESSFLDMVEDTEELIEMLILCNNNMPLMTFNSLEIRVASDGWYNILLALTVFKKDRKKSYEKSDRCKFLS